MTKDILFLLPPGFKDNERREFCPECAELWGVLSWYPAIKESLSIQYVDITHPREPICNLLGEGKWNAPTLVLAPGQSAQAVCRPQTAKGRTYLGSARQIALHWAETYGIAVPRGSAG